jgi:site-specific DNA recombinase
LKGGEQQMIGTYYRLSLTDEDVGADKAESNSIQGQRGLVEGYIMARPELATEPRQEYVDDGYSGASTSRPAFQRLIQDAQDGKAKTIIVKDFSRFARDYIEAGDYMERIFPLLGVRFISVNDGYDSGMQIGNDVRGLEVAIRIICKP